MHNSASSSPHPSDDSGSYTFCANARIPGIAATFLADAALVGAAAYSSHDTVTLATLAILALPVTLANFVTVRTVMDMIRARSENILPPPKP